MAEATSEVDICNSALLLVGDSPIISLTEGSTRSVVCSQHYYKARNASLRAYPWAFALRRKSLARLVAAPTWGYAYAYQLPEDCLRVWSIEHSSRVHWVREGNQLLTDLESVNIRYISKVTDPEQFDALFLDTLAARLAWTICVPLTGKRTLAETLYALYKEKISEAEEIDSQEGEPEEIDDDHEILAVR